MKILVTGGAGYIGSHTIIELLKDPDLEVISADCFLNSSVKTFDRIKKISGKAVTNYPIDLCDEAAARTIFEKEKNISAIIHFAALKSVPESVKDPALYFHNNNESLKNMLRLTKEFHLNCFIFSSSCSVYGNINALPVNENTPLGKAESPYAQTKQDGEKILHEFAAMNKSVKCISLRYFNPVGAHPSGLNGELSLKSPDNLVPIITRTAIGKIKETVIFGNDFDTRDGTCIRDYVHVCDIADAHVKALHFLTGNNNDKNYSVFNLGTGKGISVLEAITAFEKVSGKKLNYRIGPRRAGDVEAIYSDCSLAEKILAWKPNYSIVDMMSSAWKWEQNLAHE